MNAKWQIAIACVLGLLIAADCAFQFAEYRSLKAIKFELAQKKGKVELFKNYDVTLAPGGWQGALLGPSSDACAYVAEVTPLEPGSRDGAFIQKNVVQPEFDGKVWNDVLRLSLPSDCNALLVNVRVYKITAEK